MVADVVCGEFQKERGPKVLDLLRYMKIDGDLEGWELWIWKGRVDEEKCWIWG